MRCRKLVHDSDRGGEFELRDILNDEPGMSPMQIWCNESQERYVVAVDKNRYAEFEDICRRERCLYSRVGVATSEQSLALHDRHFAARDQSIPDPIDLPMEVLFGLPPKMSRNVVSCEQPCPDSDFSKVDIAEALDRVLSLPAVADKTFLVTIGDRSVTGLICRDQMVGPWQVPVADVAVTASGYRSRVGEAFAIGERTPVAMVDAPASGRLAITEAVTNLAAAAVGSNRQDTTVCQLDGCCWGARP